MLDEGTIPAADRYFEGGAVSIGGHLAAHRKSSYRVGIECLEELGSLIEEVDDLFLRLVVRVAFCIQGANASSMLAPFMLPEDFICAIVGIVEPVGVHVVEECGSTVGFEDGGDVGVLPFLITILTISTVTVVGP